MDLAAQQWGLVTAAQAKAEGVSPVMLSRLVDKAILARVRFGVYATESTPWAPVMEIRAQWLALEPRVLAADRLHNPAPVVVSHESAAALHRIGDLDSHGVHFITPVRRQTRQSGVVFHLVEVPPQDWVVVAGLPVTTPLRTVIDLAQAGHEPEHLTDMIANILDQRLANREEISEALVEITELLGMPSSNRVGVHAWLNERFPLPSSSTEELVRQQIDEVFAPIQEQMRTLMEQITPSLPSPDLSQVLSQLLLQDPRWQEVSERLAASLRTEEFSSQAEQILRHFPSPPAVIAENRGEHTADRDPTDPEPMEGHGVEADDKPEGNENTRKKNRE